MRRALVVTALVVAAAVTSAPARGQDEAGAYPGISALLDARARALLAGDREDFLATVDAANPAFLSRQRLLFDGFRRVGLASYSLEVSEDFFPELTTEREVLRYGADARPTVLHVIERYQITGYDPQPAIEDLYLTFVRRPDGWRIASDSDLEDVTLFSGRKPWEFGPVVTRESEHFLYVSHPDLASSAPSVLDSAERALDRVEGSWPLPWHERVVILAPSDSEELGRIIQSTFDLDVFVAFAVSGVERESNWELRGHRIMLNWPNFAQYADETRERILTHELLHVATRGLAGPNVPAFVDEGVAEWGSGDAATGVLAGRVQGGTFDELLPTDHEFITGEDADIATAYQESFTAIRYAASEYGADAVGDFYRTLGKARLVPGTWRYQVGRALRAVFGVGFGQFQRAWAGSVEATYG